MLKARPLKPTTTRRGPHASSFVARCLSPLPEVTRHRKHAGDSVKRTAEGRLHKLSSQEILRVSEEGPHDPLLAQDLMPSTNGNLEVPQSLPLKPSTAV